MVSRLRHFYSQQSKAVTSSDITEAGIIPPTIIFVNDRDTTHIVAHHLCGLVSDKFKGRIAVYHAYIGDISKRWMLHDFDHDKLSILIATESLTMVSTPCLRYYTTL
jgi:superfamily II DNA helicase RecQ